MITLGKVGRTAFDDLFGGKFGLESNAVLQGPTFGVDTSIVQISEELVLVVASDPASFIPALGVKESAWLTVALTANDIATSGYLPKYAQVVLNLTHKITNEELTEYWNYIHQFCTEIGVSITGGHTGFADVGASTLAGGVTMFAVAENDHVKCSSFALPHQDLILTKTAALSSAAILAKSFPNHTKQHLGNEAYEDLAASFYQTSIVPEVKVLKDMPNIMQNISAMHDVTEGGSLGAIYELCEAGGVGVKVNVDAIHVDENQKAICNLFEIDPLRSVGAGSLLIACDKSVSERILNEFNNNAIQASIVGETLPVDEGKTIVSGSGEDEFKYWNVDPYWAAFFDAVENGLS